MDLTVDRNEKIWAPANSGSLDHGFVQVWKDKDGNESTQHLRALCRGTIARHADTRFVGKDEVSGRICTNCLKLANAMWDRAEASMRSATEADDLGYVAPVDEPVIIARDEADAIWIRAERQAARRMDAAHAEAIEMDQAGEALTHPHREAMDNADHEGVPMIRRVSHHGRKVWMVDGLANRFVDYGRARSARDRMVARQAADQTPGGEVSFPELRSRLRL